MKGFPKKYARELGLTMEQNDAAQNAWLEGQRGTIDVRWATDGHTCQRQVRAASTCKGCAKALRRAAKVAMQPLPAKPQKVTYYGYEALLRAYTGDAQVAFTLSVAANRRTYTEHQEGRAA